MMPYKISEEGAAGYRPPLKELAYGRPAPRPTIEAFSGLTASSFLPLLGFFVAIWYSFKKRAVANNRPSLISISIWSQPRETSVATGLALLIRGPYVQVCF
jgi:hypothetical protein